MLTFTLRGRKEQFNRTRGAAHALFTSCMNTLHKSKNRTHGDSKWICDTSPLAFWGLVLELLCFHKSYSI